MTRVALPLQQNGEPLADEPVVKLPPLFRAQLAHDARALLLDNWRDVPRKVGRQSSPANGVGKNVKVSQRQGIQKLHGARKAFFGLSGKTHNNVASQRCMGKS